MNTIILSYVLLLYMLFALFLRKFKNRKAIQDIKLPPGPWKLPFIGSLHHLVGEQTHLRLRRLAREYGPLVHLKLGEINFVVITSSELAFQIMKTHDTNFASRPEFIGTNIIFYDSLDIVFSPYGKYWSQLRKICMVELLGAKVLASLDLIREEEGENLVQSIHMANGSPLNLIEIFFSLGNTYVSRAAFGKKCAQERRFIDTMKKAIECLLGFSIVELYPSLSYLRGLTSFKAQLEKVHQQLDEILDEIFEEHMAEKKNGDYIHEDIVDILFKFVDNKQFNIPLTKNNIKAVILDLFFGGTFTTALTMEWAIFELIRHPNIMQKVQLEVRTAFEGKEKIEIREISKLPYLRQIIKETLRLHPPGPLLLPRLCHNTIKLGGYTIPSGSRIIINAWAIMRDPKYWIDSERFQPERFEGTTMDYEGTKFEYIPFGAGRRICPGKTFAIAGIEFWLAQLLFHFDWKLPGDKKPEDLDLKVVFGLTISRKSDLFLQATPHKCSSPLTK